MLWLKRRKEVVYCSIILQGQWPTESIADSYIYSVEHDHNVSSIDQVNGKAVSTFKFLKFQNSNRTIFADRNSESTFLISICQPECGSKIDSPAVDQIKIEGKTEWNILNRIICHD